MVAGIAKDLGASCRHKFHHTRVEELESREDRSAELGYEDLPPALTASLRRLQATGGDHEEVQLQYCELHAVAATKKRFLKAGRYPAEEREALNDLINAQGKLLRYGLPCRH